MKLVAVSDFMLIPPEVEYVLLESIETTCLAFGKPAHTCVPLVLDI